MYALGDMRFGIPIAGAYAGGGGAENINKNIESM